MHEQPPTDPQLHHDAAGPDAVMPGAVGADHDVVVPTDHKAAHLAKGERRAADTLWRANPREQGLLGLTDAIAFFGARGWSVSLPLIDSQPYDLVVDDGERLHRVQVKTTTYRRRTGRFVVALATSGGNQSFHTKKRFESSSCDLLYVLTDERSRYVIPTHAITAASELTLGAKVARYRVDG